MRKKIYILFLITMIVFTFIFSACTGGTKKSYPLFRSQVAKNIRCRLKPRIFFQAVISERI